jgi:Arc/MetJ-type ribon-helix-helix transcriptional regulator
MRSIINISLPIELLKFAKKEVKKGDFASVSEFFRHLLRLWKTKQLGNDLHKDRKAFEEGKGKVLNSLADLA